MRGHLKLKIGVVGWMLFASAPAPSDQRWEGVIRATAGSALKSETPASLSLEPEARLTWAEGHRTSLGLFVAKPFSVYEPWSLARTSLAHRWTFRENADIAGRTGLALIAWELDRWSVDGGLIRTTAWAEVEAGVGARWSVLARVAPFTQASRFNQRADGRPIPRFGLTERFEVAWHSGFLEISAGLVLEQRREGTWKNGFDFFQQVRFDIAPHWRLGVGHSFATQILDESTGVARGVRWLDGRDNRFAVYLEGSV